MKSIETLMFRLGFKQQSEENTPKCQTYETWTRIMHHSFSQEVWLLAGNLVPVLKGTPKFKEGDPALDGTARMPSLRSRAITCTQESEVVVGRDCFVRSLGLSYQHRRH